MLELNKIYNMDCLDGLKQLDDNSVDLVITDPPYGISFQSNHRKEKHLKIVGDDKFPLEIVNECFRVAKNAVYIFCRWDNISELPKPKSIIAWIKNNWSMGDLNHEHGRQWEAICFYPQQEHNFIKRIPDVIHCNRTGNELHPTQKPVKLIRELIKSNKGQIILDPFIGSGTTALACKQLERDYIGFELERKYYDIANKRLEQDNLKDWFNNNPTK